jgi:hypothetical protein
MYIREIFTRNITKNQGNLYWEQFEKIEKHIMDKNNFDSIGKNKIDLEQKRRKMIIILE